MTRILFYIYKKKSNQNYFFIVRFFKKKKKKIHNVPLPPFLWATAPFIQTQYKKMIIRKLNTLS